MYYIWIPIQIFLLIITAYFTYKLNVYKKPIYFIITWLITLVPMWSIVALYSKRLVFDGLLYDILLVVSYTVAILIFTKTHQTLTVINYMGLFFVVVGLFFFRIK